MSESVDEIAALFSAAGDAPLRLTRNIGTPVFINRQRIAYWHGYTRGRTGLDSRETSLKQA